MKKFIGYEKGVNLGGWLSQYDTYDDGHFCSFIQEKDIEKIASWKLDHVRIPVDYPLFEKDDGSRNEAGYYYLKKAKEWCRKYHLNMVLDLHETFGYSFDPLKKEMDREKFFHDETLQSRFISLWKNIALTFKDDHEGLALELLNEVVPSDVYLEWNSISSKTIQEIRKTLPHTPIIIGGVRYNDVNAVPLLEKPYDENIVYNFHCYEPFAFTHQKAYWVEGMTRDFSMPYPDTIENYQKASKKFSKELGNNIQKLGGNKITPEYFTTIFLPAIEHAKKNNVPLYCGEYGVIDQADEKDTLRWFEDINRAFKENSISHSIWNYKEKDFGIEGEHYKNILPEILKSI